MTDPDMPLIPVPNNYSGTKGITIRAHLASLAMQAIIPIMSERPSRELEAIDVAKAAVQYADALIAELNK